MLDKGAYVTQDSGMLALEAVQKFIVLYRYLRRYSRNLQCQGVRGRELSTLRYLHEEGPLTIGQISDYLFISVSSTSELISRMEEAGYVVRRRSTVDSRVVFVELTFKGHQLAEETPTGGIPLLRERIKALPHDELVLIDEAFSRLIGVMEIDAQDYE
jgi:DNA-binding MarR family transcriptional regulator